MSLMINDAHIQYYHNDVARMTLSGYNHFASPKYLVDEACIWALLDREVCTTLGKTFRTCTHVTLPMLLYLEIGL